MAENQDIAAPVDLTQEQLKRAELLAEYEKEVEGPRGERNAGIESHDREWAEKWAKLQGEIDQVRGSKATELENSGVPEDQRKSLLAMEAAKVLESHDSERAKASVELDAKLPQPKKWMDFLEEKGRTDGDPTIASLIEEAKLAPEPSFSGVSDGQARAAMTELSYKLEKDGIHYQRHGKEVLRDTGVRIDVKQLDDRDIEAALRIAGQKFDLGQGLILTGDAAFKMRSAEIAGRLGLPVQGKDPAIQAAWAKGRDSVYPLKQVHSPFIDRSISGAARDQELKPVQIRLDFPLVDHAEKLGIDIADKSDKGYVAEMPAERYLAAMAAWRDTSWDALHALASADLTSPDELDLAGLNLEQNQDLLPLLETDRNVLSQLGRDLVLVRDSHALESRGNSAGLEYQTSQDRVAAAKQFEISLNSRNVDEQAAEQNQQVKHEVGEEAKRVAELKQEERMAWAAEKVNQLPHDERVEASRQYKEASKSGDPAEIEHQSQTLLNRVEEAREREVKQESEVESKENEYEDQSVGL